MAYTKPIMKSIQNRKAYHDFQILEKFEAGISLEGCEVKSIRAGHATLQDSFARVINGELWLINCHILPYTGTYQFQAPSPTRDRKLLMHKSEVVKLTKKTQEKGLTLIPVAMYFSKNRLKVELGLAKSKKTYDKRDDLKKRDSQRDIERGLAHKNRG